MPPEWRIRVLLTDFRLSDSAWSVDVFSECSSGKVLSGYGDQIVNADVHGLHFNHPRSRSKIVFKLLEGLQADERGFRRGGQLRLEFLRDSVLSTGNQCENNVLRATTRICVSEYHVVHGVLLDVDIDHNHRLKVAEGRVSHS